MVHYFDKWSQFEDFRKRRVFFVNIPTQHTFEDYYCAVLNGFYSDSGHLPIIKNVLVPLWHRISHNVRYNLQPPYKLAFAIARPPGWERVSLVDQQEAAVYSGSWICNSEERLIRVFPPRTKDGKEQPDIGLTFPMSPQTLRGYGDPMYIEALLFNFIQTFIVNQELSIISARDQLVASEIYPS